MRRILPMLAIAAVAALASCKTAKSPALLTPDPAAVARPAPDSFDVVFRTGRGPFTMRAYRAWSPAGVDRFHYLVSNGYYDKVKFFRNIPGFMAQFGIHGDPEINRVWESRPIADDPVMQSNTEGMVTYAMAGPYTRTVQLFINKRDNSRLDGMGFAPIGKVIDGMSVVHSLYTGYGDGPPQGRGPDQGLINRDGNRYLNRLFPQLDSIVMARLK
jgi:peptidyl-prolyl cis-trans isomerase A (cyclophilin A)